MKNKIIIDTENKKEEYNILFKVETDKNVNYIVYTNGEKNNEGEVVAYAANYKIVNGKQVLEPIEDDYTLEFLDSVLIQVQNKMNKEIGD